jgi:hypothetical protein
MLHHVSSSVASFAAAARKHCLLVPHMPDWTSFYFSPERQVGLLLAPLSGKSPDKAMRNTFVTAGLYMGAWGPLCYLSWRVYIGWYATPGED